MIEAKAVKASIYLSGGVIQCRGTVPLTVGQQSVLISAMSTESDTSSVKVAMPSWVKVNDVQTVYLDDEETNQQLKPLKDAIGELENRITINKDLATLWKTNADFTAKQSSQVADVVDYMEKLPGRLEKLNRETAELNDQLSEKKKQFNEKKEELGRPLIRVSLVSDRQQDVDYEISYREPGISWNPFYEIHSNETEGVYLRLRGKIIQHYYRQLKNIEIVLLSAQSSNGGNVPVLYPQYANFRAEMARKAKYAYSANMVMGAAAAMDMAVAEEALEDTAEMPAFSNFTAQVSQNDTMMEYDLSGKWTLDQNSEVICDIEEKKVEGRYHIVTVPKIDEGAYLAYEVNTSDIDEILQSYAVVYHNDTYLGNVYINADLTKDKYDLSLGKDELVKVKRNQKRKYTSQMLLKGLSKTEYEYEIRVSNNKNKACDITVIDQIPVSTEKTITIEPKELSGGELKKETGEIRWNFQLDPSSTKAITLGYDVSWPKDKKINL